MFLDMHSAEGDQTRPAQAAQAVTMKDSDHASQVA